MRSAYQIQIVSFHEFDGDLRSEEPSGASRTDRPRLDFLRVWPHEIAEGTFVWDLLVAID